MLVRVDTYAPISVALLLAVDNTVDQVQAHHVSFCCL